MSWLDKNFSNCKLQNVIRATENMDTCMGFHKETCLKGHVIFKLTQGTWAGLTLGIFSKIKAYLHIILVTS